MLKSLYTGRRSLLLAASVACLLLITAGIGLFDPSDAVESTSDSTCIRLPIIMYHSVITSKAITGDYIVSPEIFRSDMIYLKENGYTTIFISELVDYICSNGLIPEKPVIITLDDGYLNNLTNVLPILEELDLKAVISIVGRYTEQFSNAPDPNPAYGYLTWDDISILADSGHVEIGSHTYDMHELGARRGAMRRSGESADQYRSLLTDDLTKLQTLLKEKSGVVPTVFAYPYGLVSEGSLEVIKSLGFSAALTCRERVNLISKDPDQLYSLCRFNRPQKYSTAEFMKRIDP